MYALPQHTLKLYTISCNSAEQVEDRQLQIIQSRTSSQSLFAVYFQRTKSAYLVVPFITSCIANYNLSTNCRKLFTNRTRQKNNWSRWAHKLFSTYPMYYYTLLPAHINVTSFLIITTDKPSVPEKKTALCCSHHCHRLMGSRVIIIPTALWTCMH